MDEQHIEIGFDSGHDRGNSYTEYFNFSNYLLITSLDYVTLSIQIIEKEKLIFTFLEGNGFQLHSDHTITKGNYARKRTYESERNTVDIFYRHRFPSNFIPPICFTLRHPTEEFLQLLIATAKYHRMGVKLSMVEFTFDFYADNVESFRDFLAHHLFFKKQRTRACWKDNTFYTNNIRKSERGMRLYIKEGDIKRKFARLELIMKRSALRKLGLEFPMKNIDNLNLSDSFEFRELNEKAVREYLLWQIRHRKFPLRRLIKRGTTRTEWINNYMDLLKCKKSLMEKVDLLKMRWAVPLQYARFMKPMEDFNQKFFSAVKGQRFIPDRHEKSLFERRYRLIKRNPGIPKK